MAGKSKKGRVRRRMDAMEDMASGKKPKAKKTKGTVMGYAQGGAVCRANRT